MTKLMTPEEHTEIYKTMAETIVSEEPLDARVERGALHLDEHFPGWADKIDLTLFNIRSAEDCVIGQLNGNFWNVTINNIAKIYPVDEYASSGPLEWFGQDNKLQQFSVSHGFYTEEDGVYDVLQDDWKKAIKARQSVEA